MYRLTLLLIVFVAAGTAAQESGVRLGELTWPEAQQRMRDAPIVILPFGAGAKEHGPHLPMNADQVVMEYLLETAIANRNVVVAPPVLHGWFPAFRDFPGTEVADPAVFEAYIREIGLSLVRSGAQRLLFLNTGIAKATGLPISIAAREIRVQTGVPTLVVSWDDLDTEEGAALAEQREGGHSDEIETSINLHLQPERVRMDLAMTDYGNRPAKDYGGYLPGVFSGDERDPNYSQTGIYGDATLATAEKGDKVLRLMTDEWIKALDGFAGTPVRESR